MTSMQYPFIERIRDLYECVLIQEKCVVCGSESGTGRSLCGSCLDTLFLVSITRLSFARSDSERCLKCGRPLVSSRELCTACRSAPMFTFIDRIIPLYPYTVIGQELLTGWKISGMRGLSWPFARCLASVLEKTKTDVSFAVVPVPPRPGKIREKGWDQVDELARILQKQFRFTVLRCLSRSNSLQQKKLGRSARMHNLKGHIHVIGGLELPDTVVLLDDLMTTGATLDSCAETLKNAGCGKVYGITLFYD